MPAININSRTEPPIAADNIKTRWLLRLAFSTLLLFSAGLGSEDGEGDDLGEWTTWGFAVTAGVGDGERGLGDRDGDDEGALFSTATSGRSRSRTGRNSFRKLFRREKDDTLSNFLPATFPSASEVLQII